MIEENLVFYKMHGSGNDFVLFDLRQVKVAEQEMEAWAKKLCARGFGIGADGLIFLEPEEDTGASYKWHFFNADGSRAEMCGNGSRCAAWLAVKLGLAPKEHTFLTDAGLIKAQVIGEDEVKVQLTPPKDLQLNILLDLENKEWKVHFVNTGVPHCVVFREDVQTTEVANLGRTIRFHSHFQPAGTNVNFAQVVDRKKILLRTYERGVEVETYACGTGAAATAYVAFNLGLVDSTVELITSGQEKLIISIERENLFLQGKAVLVYKGYLNKQILTS